MAWEWSSCKQTGDACIDVATTMRCFWKRILKRTGDFEGHARMTKMDARVSMIHQGLCRVQMVLPEKNGPRKTRNY